MADFSISKPGPRRFDGLAGVDIVAGRVAGTSVVHKFGQNVAVGTTLVPIALGGVYPMMQVAGAVTLRVKAGGNANDTAAGTGAREVTLIGLDETGAEVSETVATAGASASSATSATFTRLYRAYVSAAGAYPTTAVSSHDADIVIEDSGGAGDWATLDWIAAAEGHGQTQIACYSVPLGKTAYLKSALVQVDSTRAVTVELYQRQNLLETAAPFSAKRIVVEFAALTATVALNPTTPLGPFPALTDLFWMGRVATSTGGVTIDFELIIEDA